MDYYLKDENLSFGAKGLLTYLLQDTVYEGINGKLLSRVSADTVRGTYVLLDELYEQNYIKKIQKRDGHKYMGYHYFIFMTPESRDDLYESF